MATSYRTVKSESSSKQGGPDWRILSPIGPTVAYHVSCVLNNKIYIHGGIDKKGSTDPLNKMWCMDLDATIWNEIYARNSPALSHHACVSLANRYLLFIGKIHTFHFCRKSFIFFISKVIQTCLHISNSGA